MNKVVTAENPRVVAIGASAGGLDAFRKLIENLPVDTDMAFVLLTHILRGSSSLLPEILAHSTKMPVIQVTEGVRLCPNHVYVLPPDKFMEIQKGPRRPLELPPSVAGSKSPRRPDVQFIVSLTLPPAQA